MILNQKSIKLYYHLLLIILFSGCGVEENNDTTVSSYISGTQFNFHQDINKLYIHTEILPDFNGKILDNVFVEWLGTKKGNNPDTLALFDDGTQGDIIFGDTFDVGAPTDATVTAAKLTSINGAYRNVQTLTGGLSIAASENASIVGPITVSSGQTITVASGGTLVIL